MDAPSCFGSGAVSSRELAFKGLSTLVSSLYGTCGSTFGTVLKLLLPNVVLNAEAARAAQPSKEAVTTALQTVDFIVDTVQASAAGATRASPLMGPALYFLHYVMVQVTEKAEFRRLALDCIAAIVEVRAFAYTCV